MADRRLLSLLIVLAAVAAPAAALRATCVGSSCHRPGHAVLAVPICDVPSGTRRLLASGYAEVSSPDVIALSHRGPSRSAREARVPLVFWGKGVRSGTLPKGTSLADVTPTLERSFGVRPGRFTSARRLGHALALGQPDAAPSLALEVVWLGVGTSDLERAGRSWPFLRGLMREGRATLEASADSLPVDPVPVLTTLGTGSPPSEHGVTGSVMRSPYTDEIVRGWDPASTPSALPTFAEDVLHSAETSRAALVTPDPRDGGVVGGGFYVGSPRPRIVVRPGPAREQERAAIGQLREWSGSSGPDVLVVALSGSVQRLDDVTRNLFAAARRFGRTVTAVVTATGHREHGSTGVAVTRLLRARLGRPAVAAIGDGGLFLRPNVSSQQVAAALPTLRAGGRPLFTDAFPTYSLPLAGFC